MNDNGNIKIIDLNSINKSDFFEIKQGAVMIGNEKMDIKQIGLSEISINRLVNFLNSYLLLRKV